MSPDPMPLRFFWFLYFNLVIDKDEGQEDDRPPA